MAEQPFHAVLLHPQAVETMGEGIASYVRGGALGPHVVCRQISTSGPYFEMVFETQDSDGRAVDMEVMVPHAYIRMVLSVKGDGSFGFIRRWREEPASPTASTATSHPSVDDTAAEASAPPPAQAETESRA